LGETLVKLFGCAGKQRGEKREITETEGVRTGPPKP